METNEIKKEPVEKIHEFLMLVYKSLKDGQVKKFSPSAMATRAGTQGSVATICGPDFMGIYQTNDEGLFSWNPSYEPSPELAEKVLNENNAYHRMNDTGRSIEKINEDNNGQNLYPYRLNDVWQAIGYARLDNAKKALIQGFKEGMDFLSVRNEADGYNENTGRSEDGRFVSEIIYITEDCLLEFAANAQTSVGKAFNRRLIKYFNGVRKNLLAYKMVGGRIARDMDVIEEIRDIAAQALKNKSLNLRDHLNEEFTMARDKDGMTYNPNNKQYVAFPQEYINNEKPIMTFAETVLRVFNPGIPEETLKPFLMELFPSQNETGYETRHPHLRIFKSKAS